nr:DUF6644 family protein [Pseudomonas sp.]
MSAELIAWLYASSLSTAIRDMLWVVPTVQSVHIIAIAALFGSAVISDLRLAGVLAVDRPTREVIGRYYPWMRNALLVLLATGLVMIIGEPDRVLVNSTFWLKMALVIGAFAVTWSIRRPLLKPAGGGPQSDASHPGIKLLAWLSIALWCVVIFCGRWIAYSI